MTISKQPGADTREITKNIMAAMSSPFLISLVNTYQDDKFVYMLLGLVQGGELYNVRF